MAMQTNDCELFDMWTKLLRTVLAAPHISIVSLVMFKQQALTINSLLIIIKLIILNIIFIKLK
jgi:hypothetical protein